MAKKQKTKVYKEPQRYKALTDGGKTAFGELKEKSDPNSGFKGYSISEQEANSRAWKNQQNLATYTRTRSGQLSINGKNTQGAVTWAMTPKNDDGTPILNKKGEARQSGRSQVADRSKRNYDVRAGLNNITPRAMEAMIRTGQVRVVDGSMVGGNGNVIRMKKNGNYSMGLSIG